MVKETVDVMVEGGRATAAPPLGPALGPLKVNIGQVVAEINKKTEAFKGMKVPVKVVVDSDTKAFDISVGTPPVSGLIKKELNVQVGSGIPNKDKVGNLAIEDLIKIAKMKQDALSAKDMKGMVKTVAGSCHSLGVLIEGKPAQEINKELDIGKYDDVISKQKTDVSQEKRTVLAEQFAVFQKRFATEVSRIKEAKKAEKAEKDSKKAAAAPAPGGKAAPTKTEAPAKAPAKK